MWVRFLLGALRWHSIFLEVVRLDSFAQDAKIELNNMSEYKAIKISSIAVGKHKDDLCDFFGQYPKEDIHFEINNDSLVINLRQIDFPAFKNNVELIRSSNGFNQVLDTVVKNIENIKSYGLKGSKRLYVDYNKERKVKNRKDKEKKRGLYYYAQNNNFFTQSSELLKKFSNEI